MKLVLTKTTKKIGKWMLRNCRAQLKDVGEVHRMDNLYEQHSFSASVETQTDSSDDAMPDGPTVEDHYDHWRDYILPDAGTPDGDGEDTAQDDGTSTAGAAKRRRAMRPGRAEPAPKWSPSPIH